MREAYNKQLEKLHNELTLMGAMCEEAIDCAIRGLVLNDRQLRQRALELEREIDDKEREIGFFCVMLLIREQPVARDLLFITRSQKMINDMERIGDNAADIAFLFEQSEDEQRYFVGKYMEDMARSVSKIISDAVDCFVKNKVEEAKDIILFDDVIDNHFREIKKDFIKHIEEDGKNAEIWLDILMTAKYLERIGDHAKNIAKLVVYTIGDQR
ncbi:MAG: phosphate signaling complex protein PhoU [Chitinispirillales bacterium]|jgi:phosphate transport system protein|nr:phosphate signaling complex protein PhoU [Chitinispirillales bacterium]